MWRNNGFKPTTHLRHMRANFAYFISCHLIMSHAWKHICHKPHLRPESKVNTLCSRSVAGFRCVCPISPQMSLIPHKPEKTRRWKQRRGSCRGMRAGRARALISHACCCQTKCLCCWEAFPCLALNDSNWDFIYYHQPYNVMNTVGKNKHIVGWMPNAGTVHSRRGMQYSLD